MGLTADRATGTDSNGNRCVELTHPQDTSKGTDPSRAGEQSDVHSNDDAVREPEGQSTAIESIRNRQGDEKEPGHPSQQYERARDSVSRHRVGQPGVTPVHPENDRQHEHDLQRDRGGRLLSDNRCQLRVRPRTGLCAVCPQCPECPVAR